MSPKIGAEHLARGAVVYVRQSTMTQVLGNLESQKRQYALVEAARATGFAEVMVWTTAATGIEYLRVGAAVTPHSGGYRDGDCYRRS